MDFLDSPACLVTTEKRADKEKLAMGLKERGAFRDWTACLVCLVSPETLAAQDSKESLASASASLVRVGHLGCLVKLATRVCQVHLAWKVLLD